MGNLGVLFKQRQKAMEIQRLVAIKRQNQLLRVYKQRMKIKK